MEFNQARRENEIAYKDFVNGAAANLPDEKLIILQKSSDTALTRYFKARRVKDQINNYVIIYN